MLAAMIIVRPGSRRMAGHTLRGQCTVRSKPASGGATAAPLGDVAEGTVLYEGAFASALYRVKMLSIASCTATLTASPFLVFAGSDGISLTGKLAITGMVSGFGIFTTAALTVCTKSYITRCFATGTRGRVRAETLSMLGKTKSHEFALAETKAPQGFFSMFSTCSANNFNLFVHKELVRDRLLRRSLVKQ